MGTVDKPDIIRKTIVINDDYVRQNRRADGKISLIWGHANSDKKSIIIYNYVIDKNITLLNSVRIENIKKIISSNDEGTVIAHESQHIHNGAIGYHYLANSDNVYESMLLAFADEYSAMVAGYYHKTKNIDDAVNAAMKNLSGDVRKNYIQGQFVNHFKLLKKQWGESKNLYEHKVDDKKLRKVLNWYFTIDGQQVMRQMSRNTLMLHNSFIVSIMGDIREFIDNKIMKEKNSGMER
jgi:hypothetical protein